MSEKKIEMNVKRGTGYDILHPVTDASVVEYTKNGTLSNVETVLTTTINNMEEVVVTAKNIEIRQQGLFIIAKDTEVPSSAWVEDNTYEDYPYRASIIVDGCNENYCPDVYFDVEDIKLGIFAPIAETDLRTVYIYSKEIPSDIVIPTIKLATEADKISLVKVLALINVDKLPKTEYTEGEAISYSGMKVSAIYSDGSSKEIKNYSISPAEGTILSEGETTVNITYTEDGVTKTASFKVNAEKDIPIKLFSECTDEEFLAIAQALQDGTIKTGDLPWGVGDTRSVSLSAFTSYPSGSASTQAAQTAQLVILNVGSAGKKFIDNTDVNYIIGFKNSVAKSYYHGSNNASYSSSLLKIVENNIYNALPSTLKPAFKQFNAYTAANETATSATAYPVYMCSPAEKEVFGSRTYSVEAEANALTQFKWYETSTNRIKQLDGSNFFWWERSLVPGAFGSVCYVQHNGNESYDVVNSGYGVSPFGCI